MAPNKKQTVRSFRTGWYYEYVGPGTNTGDVRARDRVGNIFNLQQGQYELVDTATLEKQSWK